MGRIIIVSLVMIVIPDLFFNNNSIENGVKYDLFATPPSMFSVYAHPKFSSTNYNDLLEVCVFAVYHSLTIVTDNKEIRKRLYPN